VRVLIAVALIVLRFGLDSSARGLEPPLDITQYAHTAWNVRDGEFKDPISSIAQTRDGYLWFGTQFGLVRFDGVRAMVWQPPSGQQLPSINIRTVFAGSDGRLWIGTQLGLASWKDGTLTIHRESSGVVGGMIEDREGTVWVGTRYPPPGKLCGYRKDRVLCYGEHGEFGTRASSVFEDRAGNLWVGAQQSLWRWKPGEPKRFPLSDFESSRGIVEAENGGLVVAERGTLKQLSGENLVDHPAFSALHLQPSHLLRDRDGALWIGTFDRGLIHVHQQRLDQFSAADGLSGNYVRWIFEDREGNIWVATENGLDRFRRTVVATISTKQGLSEGTPWSVVTARDGSVWVGTLAGLNRLRDHTITVYRKGPAPSSRGSPRLSRWTVREVIDPGLPADVIHALFEDAKGRLWVSTHGGIAYFENERFNPVDGVPRGVQAFAGDAAGNIWLSHDDHLIHIVDHDIVEKIPWPSLGRATPAVLLRSDPVRRGLWLGFRDGTGVAYFQKNRIVASYDVTQGLGRGTVGSLHVDGEGAVWVATEGGLSRIQDGRVHTLTAKNGLPCDAVNWMIEDDDDAVWLYTACGLARIARKELNEWAAEVEQTTHLGSRVSPLILDNADGVRIHAAPGGYTPQVGKSPDGRIWFLPWDGVSVIDPRHLLFNAVPPPVHIEQITANGQTYPAMSGLRLPPRVRDLAIDFTALSFAAPENVRFRYILEGQDPDWKEVVNDRRVQYSNLRPGDYHFRVLASNNSGVWNQTGTTMTFSIAPAYYQRLWFQTSGAVAILGMLWAVHLLRVRHLVRQFTLTVEARVAERTRIARELHDTLLQSFHGLLLLFEAAFRYLPDRPEQARHTLQRALEKSVEATTEARDAVQNLRSSIFDSLELVRRLRHVAESVSIDRAGRGPAIHVAAHGTPRALEPVVANEVYRIASEALHNAVRHARAQQIGVEVCCDERQLRVRVRDDGKGFEEPQRSERADGHFGVAGMHERAKVVGGVLEVWTKPGAGTGVDLRIPAASAYTHAPSASRRLFGSAIFKARSARPN
jgi:signal transduction histidine kinase/ligand-binding sensor domain-containing protein